VAVTSYQELEKWYGEVFVSLSTHAPSLLQIGNTASYLRYLQVHGHSKVEDRVLGKKSDIELN
jgi:hypothetical protein